MHHLLYKINFFVGLCHYLHTQYLHCHANASHPAMVYFQFPFQLSSALQLMKKIRRRRVRCLRFPGVSTVTADPSLRDRKSLGPEPITEHARLANLLTVRLID